MAEEYVGRAVYYAGTHTSREGFGVVTAFEPRGQYNPDQVTIRLEDGREMRGIFLVMFAEPYGRQFWWRDEWNQHRQKKMAAIEEAAASFRQRHATV